MPAKCHQGELKSKPSTVVSHLWHVWRLRLSAGVSPPDAAYRQGAQCSERESCRGDTKGSARNHGSRRYFHANKRHFLHLMREGGGILMEVNQGSALMSFMFLRDVHFFFLEPLITDSLPQSPASVLCERVSGSLTFSLRPVVCLQQHVGFACSMLIKSLGNTEVELFWKKVRV